MAGEKVWAHREGARTDNKSMECSTAVVENYNVFQGLHAAPCCPKPPRSLMEETGLGMPQW